MLIKQPQLKAARRHAQRVGEQVGDALDNGHDGERGEVVDRLLDAWHMFITQFGDPVSDPVVHGYVAEGFRIGISKPERHRETHATLSHLLS